jgi:hypothetical protein
MFRHALLENVWFASATSMRVTRAFASNACQRGDAPMQSTNSFAVRS